MKKQEEKECKQYMIPKSVLKALRLKAAEGEMDMSEIVVAALKQYLGLKD